MTKSEITKKSVKKETKPKKKNEKITGSRKITEQEKSSLVKSLSLEESYERTIKPVKRVKRSSEEKPPLKVSRSGLSETEKAQLVGGLTFDESLKTEKKDRKKVRKKLEVSGKTRKPIKRTQITEDLVKKAKLVKGINYEEEIKEMPKKPIKKSEVSKKLKTKIKKADLKYREISRLSKEALETFEKDSTTKKRKKRISPLKEISAEGSQVFYQDVEREENATDIEIPLSSRGVKPSKFTVRRIKFSKEEESSSVGEAGSDESFSGVEVKPIKKKRAEKRAERNLPKKKVRKKEILEAEQSKSIKGLTLEDPFFGIAKTRRTKKKSDERTDKFLKKLTAKKGNDEERYSSLVEGLSFEEGFSGSSKRRKQTDKSSRKSSKELVQSVGRKPKDEDLAETRYSRLAKGVSFEDSFSGVAKFITKSFRKADKSKDYHKETSKKPKKLDETKYSRLLQGTIFERSLDEETDSTRGAKAFKGKSKKPLTKAAKKQRAISKLSTRELEREDVLKGKRKVAIRKLIGEVSEDSTFNLLKFLQLFSSRRIDSLDDSDNLKKPQSLSDRKAKRKDDEFLKETDDIFYTSSKKKKDQKKMKRVDLSSKRKNKVLSGRSLEKFDRLSSPQIQLIGESEPLKDFQGSYVKESNEQLSTRRQKAIKSELKVNKDLKTKQEIKSTKTKKKRNIKKLGLELLEDMSYERPSEGQTDKTEKLITFWVNPFSREVWMNFKNEFSDWYRQRQRIKNGEIYFPPEITNLQDLEDAKKFKGFYLPNKLLSATEHYFEIVTKKYLWSWPGKLSYYIGNNYFNLLYQEWSKIRSSSPLKRKQGSLAEASENPFKKRKIKKVKQSLRIIPTPLTSIASKNRKVMRNIYEKSWKRNFPWSHIQFSPAKYKGSKLKTLRPTLADQENSVLYEKPQIPPYWKTIRAKAEYASSSLYREFLENFGEFELLNYGKDSWETIKTLRERYFDNHLSNEELSFQANQEIAPELNRMMKLLNEQPFLVFPLGASPAMYYILPELDGISEALSRHNIDPDKKKPVSLKDVHIRTLKGVPKNILSSSEHALSFSADECLEIEKKEFNKFIRFRDFEIDEYSKSFYSKFSESMLLQCSILEKIKELQKFKKKIPIWTFINELFLLDNDGLNVEGYLPSFENQVIKEEYKKGSFSHSLMYWARESKKTAPLDASIRHNPRKNPILEKLNKLELKLS